MDTETVTQPVRDANSLEVLPRTQHLRTLSFEAMYDERRDLERADLRRDMDGKACRDSLWLALYTSQLCEWPDVTDSIFDVITDVDARRSQEGSRL
jgi:hypothetical protein